MKQHKGLIIAIIIILLMLFANKFIFKTDYKREETLVEPTEDVTFRVFEHTQLGIVPTE